MMFLKLQGLCNNPFDEFELKHSMKLIEEVKLWTKHSVVEC